ncbi:hypothetical protein D3C86_1558830 [compost metagenome]
MIGGALEGPETDMAVRQPHHDRRAGGRGLVAPRQRLAGLDQGQDAAGRNPQTFQHGRGQHLAHSAFECEASIGVPRPRRLAGAFCAQIKQAVLIVAQLRGQKSASVADVGVVGAELMTVIAHGDRAGLAGQGLEAPKVA